MWVFCPEPEDATDLTTYPGGWWDGKITEYYTPEEAQQTATDLGLQDPDFNVQFHFYDGADEWQLYLRLDLDKYDPHVVIEPADWAWSLEEEPCPAEVCPAAPVEHWKRARATEFDDEETDAGEQQTVKRPRSGSASGYREVAAPFQVDITPINKSELDLSLLMANEPALMAKAKPELSFDERLANLTKSFPQLPSELLHQALSKHDGHAGRAKIELGRRCAAA